LFTLTQSGFTPIEEFDFPNRYFRIWTYYKGHRQLILRAPHFKSIQEPTFPTRVDILFKDVHALKLPTDMQGLSVSIADARTADRITHEIALPEYGDQTIYLVRGSDFTGYVISGSATATEDDGDDSAPSALMPYVRTTFYLGPHGESEAPTPPSARKGRRRVDRRRHRLATSSSRVGGDTGAHRTDLYDIAKLTAGARRLDERGASTDEVLTYLRQAGASPIASMNVLHEMAGISVSEAKSIVWNSTTWADKKADQETFIADAEKVLSDLDRTALQIGSSDSDHLRISVLGRQASTDGLDLSVLECHVDVRAGGSRAEFSGWFPAQSFGKLRDDFATLDRSFSPGSVEFEPGHEASIKFTVRVGTTGPVEISGVAIDGLGSGNEQKLQFDFTVGDSLRAILSSARAVADTYPSP
jgi:hypothetical protein